MSSIQQVHLGGRRRSLVLFANTLNILTAMLLFTGGTAWAGGVVTSCSEGNLRAAMAGGGTVTFACDGTITLRNNLPTNLFPHPIPVTQNTVLDGTGHQITIRGTNGVGVFYVSNNVILVLVNLTVTNGVSTGGSAIRNQYGAVYATNCTFTGNLAVTNVVQNVLSSSQGGAILNYGGYLNLQDCVFSNNRAVGNYFIFDSYPGVFIVGIDGQGGAIFNNGALVINNCRFDQNSALGADTDGTGANGQGGAIFNAGTLAVDNCTFSQNSALGGNGTVPSYMSPTAGSGAGLGGAIFNAGSLVISRSSFTNNCAVGPSGQTGMPPHHEGLGYTGGWGGDAYGSAIYNDNSSTLFLQQSAVAANIATGGNGGDGYPGEPYVLGGSGGAGGYASGAIFNAGTANLVNVTVAFNDAVAGDGGLGGSGPTTNGFGGSGIGGICDVSGFLQMTNCTVASNNATAGSGGGGISVGGIKLVSDILANTLLAGNSPSNCSGTITDAGHNLNSDASCAFNGGGSMTNTDPKLGPLADNGGPTLTMALLPGSPAIDAGGTLGAPATDQRGAPRPQGPGVDIGAFEYLCGPVFTGATIQNPTNHQMLLCGLTLNQALTLQVSTNLLNWWDATNFMAGSNGEFQCADPIPGDAQSRFYRLKSGTP